MPTNLGYFNLRDSEPGYDPSIEEAGTVMELLLQLWSSEVFTLLYEVQQHRLSYFITPLKRVHVQSCNSSKEQGLNNTFKIESTFYIVIRSEKIVKFELLASVQRTQNMNGT